MFVIYFNKSVNISYFLKNIKNIIIYSLLIIIQNIFLLLILKFLIYSTQVGLFRSHFCLTFFSFQLFFICSLPTFYLEVQSFSHIMLCLLKSSVQQHKLAKLSYAHKVTTSETPMRTDKDQISFK